MNSLRIKKKAPELYRILLDWSQDSATWILPIQARREMWSEASQRFATLQTKENGKSLARW